MKDRGILFSAPMVRALLDGSKTQTRRLFKPEHMRVEERGAGFYYTTHKRDGTFTGGGPFIASNWLHYCPYGQPGDRLWVRETWQGPLFDDMDAYRTEPDDFHKPEFCEYAADGGAAPEFMTMDDELVCRWRPSIHMPRWASRILLEITGVRVERLQDISDSDARAEGIQAAPGGMWSGADGQAGTTPRAAYALLWESINGAGSWDANPWVWVVEFKRVAP